jgi:hypothetical protein
MGEFYAWAVTGQVTRLEVWSDPDSRTNLGAGFEDEGAARIATHMAEQQKFILRSRDGADTPVHLIDSGIAMQNGHVLTIVWAAQKGATFGHCVFVENHTTGAKMRLMDNVRLIRPPAQQGRVLGFGFLATVPALLALLTWLSSPSALFAIDSATFLVIAAVVLVLLFALGAIVAKLVLEYLRTEDEERIWAAVSKAIAISRKPQSLQDRLSQRA